MRKIQNKKIKITNVETNYYNLIHEVLNSTSTKGVTIGQMREDIHILDELEKFKNKKVIEVSHKVLKKILTSLNDFTFKIKSKEFIKFYDYLESLK